MNYYFNVALILLTFLGYVLFLKDKFNYSFGKSLFFSISTIMFFMALFSFINQMVVGYYIITGFGLLYLSFTIIRTIIKKDKSILSYFNKPSFFIFIILFIFLSFATRKIDILMGWDECSYWATMVKRLFYFNTYIGDGNFHSMYYPPALTSYNYYIVKFIGFADSSLYFSQYIFVLSGLIFLIKDYDWKKIILCLLIIFGGYVFLILLLKPYVLTLYSEIPLILLSGIALISLFTAKSKSDYYFVAMLLCNIAWIKSNGLMLCLLIVLVALVQIFNCYKRKFSSSKTKEKNKYFKVFIEVIKEKKELLFVIIAPFIASFIFKVFLQIFNISNPQVAGTSIKSFLYILLRDTDSSNLVVDFANSLNKNYNYSTFNLTSIALVALIILGFWVIEKINKNNECVNNNKYITIAIFLSFALYCASLLYAYCFLFSEGEASVLASFDRYMNSFIGCIGIGFLGIISYLLVENNNNTKLKNIVVITFIAVICVTNLGDTYSIFKQLLPKTQTVTASEIMKGKDIANKYSKYLTKNDKVGFIIQGDYGLTVWASIYYMTPLKLYDPRFDTDMWSIRTSGSEDTINTVEISPQNYLDKLKSEEITHLIIENINEYFAKDYKNLFETDKIVNGLYELNYNKNKLELVKMEEK